MALAAVVTRPTDQDADDLDLVAGVRAGDDRAFELLFLRYQTRIAAYVRSMVHDHGRAEDITQDVFISALRRMRETDREIAFKPWVYEIAKNACIDAFRRSRHLNEVSFDAHDALGAGDHDRLAGMGATPDRAIDTKLDLDNLRGAFGGLSDVHHQILVMRELEGLSYRVIGERLGMSRPAVESTLFRARRRLGEEYDELVSGKRCLRVRAIVDARGRSAGVRDQRRMFRHISHCQPCRRYALAGGVDLQARPSRRPAAARIAALLPLPAFLRRPVEQEQTAALLGSQGQATVAHWSASVAGGGLDLGAVAGWTKAVVAAATVAIAGVGAGAAVTEREALQDFMSRAPAFSGSGHSSDPVAGGPGMQQRERKDVTRQPATGGAGRKTGDGGANKLSPGSAGMSRAPGDSERPATKERHPGPTNGDARSDPGKPQDGASPKARRPGTDPPKAVDDVVRRTLGTPGGEGPAAGVGDAVGDISGAVGNTVSGVTGTADAAARTTTQPVAGVAQRVTSAVTTTAQTALPGS